jgi:serine phosphatase RsbU (regulator of sigma subunit)
VVAGLRAALDAGQEYTTELLNYRKDGTPFWNRLALTPLRDTAGRVTHYVGVQSDITDRVRAEKALEVANAKMVRNLELAARVQQGFLPVGFRARDPLRAAWRFRPCERLAGDLLGIAYLDASRVALHLLDVTGHGTAAALLAASANQALGALAGNPPAEVADALNRRFRWDAHTAQFITLVYGVLDVDSLVFEYVTAGHPPPVIHAGAGSALPERGDGLPIGVGDARYQPARVQLQAGGRLLLFSDGVSELRNAAGEFFGLDRIRRALAETSALPLDESLDRILARLQEWHGRSEFDDDVSLLAVEVCSG